MDVPQGRFNGEGVRWAPLLGGAKKSATLWCPQGHMGSLEGHDIAPDGTVTPSVVCPEKACDWHKYVRLLGWTP